MPTFDKSPVELVERFTAVVAARPAASVRKMFGYPAAFVNGNMTTGLHQANWFVRLSEADTADAGRRRRRTVRADARPTDARLHAPAGRRSPTTRTRPVRWVDRAIDHVAGLPPKK